jgi:thioredoxin 1
MENDKNMKLERIKQAELREKMKRLASIKQVKSFNEPIEVADSIFEEIIQNHSLVVVDCWAPWCGPCQMVTPVIKELERDYAGKIVFGKLNVDGNQEVSTSYEIMSIPTIISAILGE